MRKSLFGISTEFDIEEAKNKFELTSEPDDLISFVNLLINSNNQEEVILGQNYLKSMINDEELFSIEEKKLFLEFKAYSHFRLNEDEYFYKIANSLKDSELINTMLNNINKNVDINIKAAVGLGVAATVLGLAAFFINKRRK